MPYRKRPVRPEIGKTVVDELGPALLKRDEYACQACGAQAGDLNPYHPNRTLRLTFGYVAEVPKGRDVFHYIRTECENCHEGLRYLPFPKYSRVKLMTQIRRATPEDQEVVLAWLRKKFAPVNLKQSEV
jgi:hypothetical protein